VSVTRPVVFGLAGGVATSPTTSFSYDGGGEFPPALTGLGANYGTYISVSPNAANDKLYLGHDNATLIRGTTQDPIATFPTIATVVDATNNTGTSFAGVVNGTLQAFRAMHVTPDGNLLLVAFTTLNAGYVYRSNVVDPDAPVFGTGAGATTDGLPVLVLGSTQADGSAASAGQQIVERRNLGQRSFLNCTLSITTADDTPGAILCAEYVGGTVTDEQLTIWMSTDDGITWSVFWRAGETAGISRERSHFHSIHQNPTNNDIIVCTGDAGTSDKECAIIRGPNDPALWAAHNPTTGVAVSNATVIADTANGFAGYTGSQKYRAIDLIFDRGHIIYGVDSDSLNGIQRFKDDFSDADVTTVYKGEFDRMVTGKTRGGTNNLKLSSGVMLAWDFVEGGAAPSQVDECMIYGSMNGVDWYTIGQALGNTTILGVSSMAFERGAIELSNGNVYITGGGNYVMRDDVPTNNHVDSEGIWFSLGGTWSPSIGATVVAPSSWI